MESCSSKNDGGSLKSLDVSDDCSSAWNHLTEGINPDLSSNNPESQENTEAKPALSDDKPFNAIVNESQKSDKRRWSVRSPLPIRVNQNTVEIIPAPIRDDLKLQSNSSSKVISPCKLFPMLSGNKGSAFERKDPDSIKELDDNPIKRCNSAPILNDVEMKECLPLLSPKLETASISGRTRRFSATNDFRHSATKSPVCGTPKSRLRLDQLKKEETLEGIQSKETEHEREVQLQASFQATQLTTCDRRGSVDGGGSLSVPSSPCASLPSPSPSIPVPSPKHFPVPVQKSSHSRAIDFTNMHPVSPSYLPPSGIPSPLTFTASPALATCLSTLPPSPTRGIITPGKQLYSPSMQVSLPLTRNSSRSPSPSPTRRPNTYVQRRRSQSPCIMRPSALSSIKRKCDSDNEGSSSPKRAFFHNTVPSSTYINNNNLTNNCPPSTDVVMTSSNTSSIQKPSFITQSHRIHSLSSSSLDGDMYASPSPPSSHQPASIFHQVPTTFLQPSLHQLNDRCSSPASSTCSSSSLEGIRDLQPISAPTSERLQLPPPSQRKNVIVRGVREKTMNT